jgi:stress-induced morphogen
VPVGPTSVVVDSEEQPPAPSAITAAKTAEEVLEIMRPVLVHAPFWRGGNRDPRREAPVIRWTAVSLQERIQDKLGAALAPEHIEVENESRMHNVPPGSETHFKVLVVSAAFEGLGLVDRHRKVNEVLAAELKRGLHALTMRTLTPAQWREQGAVSAPSPPCLGGSKG